MATRSEIRRRYRLRYRLNLYLAGAVFTVLAGAFFILRATLDDALLDRIRAELGRDARLVERLLVDEAGPAPLAASPARLHALLAGWKRDLLPYRISLIARDGRVLADSDVADVARLENHRWRSEVRDALATGEGSAIRHSDSTAHDFLYLARAGTGDAPGGGWVLRLARELADFRAEIAAANRFLLLASLVLLLLLLAVGFAVAWRVTRPVLAMTAFAREYRLGNLAARLPVERPDELGLLGSAMNDMVEHLDWLVRELDGERSRLASVFATLHEGVLLLDGQGRVKLVNDVFRRLFPGKREYLDRPYYELVDSTELAAWLEGALGGAPGGAARGNAARGNAARGNAARGNAATTVELVRLAPVVVEATALPVADGQGLLVVLRDVTEARRFERMKSDFVANASHELKTPLSIVRGYVETLLDNDSLDEAKRREYLARIGENASRLSALVADVTALNRLESGTAHFERVDLAALVRRVVDDLAPKAERLGVAVACAAGSAAIPGDAGALESLVYNLVDNALSYNKEGGRVDVTLAAEAGRLVLRVADDGAGFPPELGERLFERFYRVDAGRSRASGGTGLGLAIAKHAAALHGGTISAASDGPGSGAVFTVTLPN